MAVWLRRRLPLLVAWVALAATLWAAAGRLDSSAAAPLLHLVVDGRPVEQAAAQLENGRVLVPLRFVAEALGLDVTWHPGRRHVYVEGGPLPVTLAAGDRRAQLGQDTVELDVPPRMIGDRVYVPLRFVAEATGARVDWLETARTVRVERAQPPAELPPLRGTALDVVRLPLGLPAEALLTAWGEPLRRDSGPDGLEWWAYRPEPDRYLRAGLGDGRLRALYVYGRGWRADAVRALSAPGEARATLGIGDRPELLWRGGRYVFDCAGDDAADGSRTVGGASSDDGGVLPPLVAGDRVVLLYVDRFADQVVAAYVAEPGTFLQADPAARLAGCTIWYRSSHPLPLPAALQPELEAAVAASEARVLLDLANVARRLHERPLLTWSDAAQAVAQAHNDDMRAHDFFSHDSPTRGSLATRIRAAGLDRCAAGENIAFGFADAVGAHHAWMNSPGHRQNLLDGDFSEYGAAAGGGYFTETYLDCR